MASHSEHTQNAAERRERRFIHYTRIEGVVALHWDSFEGGSFHVTRSKILWHLKFFYGSSNSKFYCFGSCKFQSVGRRSDETDQMSRDPRKNRLKTRRERLTKPSKLIKSHSRASIQLSTCRKASYVAPVLRARMRSHAISRIRVIIIILPLLQ